MKRMSRFRILVYVLLIGLVLPTAFSCDTDKLKDKLEELQDMLGSQFVFKAEETGIATPAGWNFVFGMQIDSAENAANLDNKFSVDLSILEEFVSVDLASINDMIAIAKVENIPGYGNRLRFANKLVVQDNVLKLDSETTGLLGDSIGSTGAGMYVVYYASAQNGYIAGNIVGCNAEVIANAQAVISESPFFTYSAANGTWALPTLAGRPAIASISAGDCACTISAPAVDTTVTPNPKSDDPAATPASSKFADGTFVVAGGTCTCCPGDPIEPPECFDMDGDGFGEGTACAGADCDDNNAAIFTPLQGYVDADLDGFGAATATAEAICSGEVLPSGYSANNADCDDANAEINPDAIDIDDDIDNDCDGTIDGGGDADTDADTDSDTDADADTDSDTDSDTDMDGGVDAGGDADTDSDTDADDAGPDGGDDTDVVVDCVDGDGDGYGEGADCMGPDCNDEDAAVYMIYEGFADLDGDTFGMGALLEECIGATVPEGIVDNNLDCDDADPAVNPDAIEVLNDGINNDCNSETPDSDGSDDIDDDPLTKHKIDFENGSLEGWTASVECELFGVDQLAYQDLFPGGRERSYLYVSSGGTGIGGCTMSTTINVPAGASTMEIKYNFVSQEYAEWVGSAYNDTFTVSLKGSPFYTVNRSVNNVALAEDWEMIAPDSLATDVAQVGESMDAMANSMNGGNGSQKFDGKLKYGQSTGSPSNGNAGKIASMALPAGQTITIVITVNDVGDKIYDSAGVIDWIRLK